MYEHHFNLSARPFDITPNPDYLYMSEKHTLALSLLEYSLVSQASIAVVTGDIGAGKTTLLNHVLGKVPDNATVCLISQTPNTLEDLVVEAMLELDQFDPGATPAERQRQFLYLVREHAKQHSRVVLMVDEAQNLDLAALEGLRILTNVNTHGRVVLQLILSGQPDLLETLRHPKLRQFAQRVAVDFHLGPLEEWETIEYIGHRLAVAQGDNAIIPWETRRTVHAASGGIPRLINTLCDIGLVYAYADGTRTVNNNLIQAVIKDRQAGGILPLARPANDTTSGLAAAAKP